MPYRFSDDYDRQRRMAQFRAPKTRNLFRRVYAFTHTPGFLALLLLAIAVTYYSL